MVGVDVLQVQIPVLFVDVLYWTNHQYFDGLVLGKLEQHISTIDTQLFGITYLISKN